MLVFPADGLPCQALEGGYMNRKSAVLLVLLVIFKRQLLQSSHLQIHEIINQNPESHTSAQFFFKDEPHLA